MLTVQEKKKMINCIIQRNLLIQTFVSQNANLLSFMIVSNDKDKGLQ